jgi:hypothetical protein
MPHYDPEKRITLGKALTMAYDLEANQEWAGAAIHPSVWESFPGLLAPLSDPGDGLYYYFREYRVPTKSGGREALRILNWRFNSVIDCGTEELLRKARLDQAPVKFENTIQYARDIRKSGALYFGEGSAKPVELGTTWIGKNPPPFEHGDDL